jgi:hypothetical protein
MRHMRSGTSFVALSIIAALFVWVMLVAPPEASAQATISTGSVQGAILDPKSAIVVSAKVTITNKDTGQKSKPEVSSAGTYNSGPLPPGTYVVRIEAQGFKTTEKTVGVAVGIITTANVTLELGSETTIITVESSAISVNTEQATVQGVLTAQQIENLPVNGRNFLDLAQLEPGVQIQDGANFDPTKNGFSSVSFAGHFGRTARIEVDGIDISDETVGTTTQNIPQIAIGEFQVGQSNLDLSTELTSTGTINVVTRSGGNDIHGEGFFYWRGDSVAAKQSLIPVPFDRKQYGARLGGPIVKDKLFFFGGLERTHQDLQAAQVFPTPFSGFNGNYNSPFRDLEPIGKLDWQLKPNWKLFYRFSYEQNSLVRGFIPNTFTPFKNVDNTPVHAAGFDFNTGRFSHNIRFGYTKFRNGIVDAVLGTGITDPAPGIAIAIGGDITCLGAGVDAFCSGPNFLAPQKTFQSNKQTKYDGSITFGRHTLRYGVGLNRIQGAVFAAFVGSAPIVTSLTPIAGQSDPLQYTVDAILIGNGQGFFTEKPGFGFPAGGSSDTRFTAYFGDQWKLRSNLTASIGLRYVRDTGRTDSDIDPIPCSASILNCTGNLLDQFGPGLGGRIHQPNKNFGPQIGLAWDPWKNGKTAIRAGFGIYYENAIWNNILFDRPPRLQQGLFFGIQEVCSGGGIAMPDGSKQTTINGKNIATQVCGQPIGSVTADALAIEAALQQATLAAGPQNNGGFIGNTLADSFNNTGTELLAPSYRTPYSLQFNIGVQRELRPGTVLNVDYIRNVGLHSLLGYDTNHVGDSRYLNLTAAQNAIATTLSNCGVPTINQAILLCPSNPTGAPPDPLNPYVPRAATIFDFAGNGLDSGYGFLGSLGATAAGVTPDTGAAFPGINPNVGANQMLFPIGKSTYNALQMKLTSHKANPMRGMTNANLVVSYAFSRLSAMARDGDFINNGFSFRDTSLRGPNGLDRRHQFSAGAMMDFKYGAAMSFITHWYSPLPSSLFLPSPANGMQGAIFTSDLDGDGSLAGNTSGQSGDLLTGTNIGSFGRDVGVSGLANLINQWNSNSAGKLTPAGQALVGAGLFTEAQLIALGAVTPTISAPPAGQEGLGNMFTFDLKLGWKIKPVHRWDRLTFEPQVSIYNLFNRQNFDSPSQPLSGILNGTAGTLNGTTRANRSNLVGLGSGVFALGAPRSLEFGFKVVF